MKKLTLFLFLLNLSTSTSQALIRGPSDIIAIFVNGEHVSISYSAWIFGAYMEMPGHEGLYFDVGFVSTNFTKDISPTERVVCWSAVEIIRVSDGPRALSINPWIGGAKYKNSHLPIMYVKEPPTLFNYTENGVYYINCESVLECTSFGYGRDLLL